MNDPKYKYRLLIAYDGTNYAGWQIQPHALTVQERIEQTLAIFLRQPIHLVGSGRTDTGVHASGQVAHFVYPHEIDLYKFLASANGLLPADIRIKAIDPVDPCFHARYSAIGKIYHYHLWLDRVQDPFHRLYSYHVHEKINVDLLYHATRAFLGTHDFTAFANSAHHGSAAHDPIRTITRLDVIPSTGGVRLEFEGNGFLYKMVRNITGTLIDVARGYLPLDDIPRIFTARDRRNASSAAPPQGLFLVQVIYSATK